VEFYSLLIRPVDLKHISVVFVRLKPLLSFIKTKWLIIYINYDDEETNKGNISS